MGQEVLPEKENTIPVTGRGKRQKNYPALMTKSLEQSSLTKKRREKGGNLRNRRKNKSVLIGALERAHQKRGCLRKKKRVFCRAKVDGFGLCRHLKKAKR